MTQAFIEWRKKELTERWKNHEYHNTADNERKRKIKERDYEDPRKRVA